MPTRAILRTVDFCTDHARLVVVAALIAATAACIYAAPHFAITTDVTQLIAAKDSTWFKNQLVYQAEFPTQAEFPAHKVMVVLDAPTPELADKAADKLAQSLSAQWSVIQSVATATALLAISVPKISRNRPRRQIEADRSRHLLFSRQSRAWAASRIPVSPSMNPRVCSMNRCRNRRFVTPA